MPTCPSCAGKRQITVMVPETRTYTTTVGADGYPAWPCNGGMPKRTTYETGRLVTRIRVCVTCNGRGKVDCLVCEDRGEVAYAGLSGPEPMIVPCSCNRGRAIAHVISHPDPALTGADA